jgi:hypothetical protein
MNNAKLAEKSFCTINFLPLSEEQFTFLLAFYKVTKKTELKKFLKNGFSNIYINPSDLSIQYPKGTNFEEIRPLLIEAKSIKNEARKIRLKESKIKAKEWLKLNKGNFNNFVLPLMAQKAGFSFEALPKKTVVQKGKMIESKHNPQLYNRIERMSFCNARFGRIRKAFAGTNSMYAGIRTDTNGMSGWNCVSWHYADFTAIINPQNTSVWVEYADGTEENITMWKHFAKINGKVFKFEIEKVFDISQEAKFEILTHFNRGNVLNVYKDKNDWCYQDRESKELYHFDNKIKYWRTRNPFIIALSAFKKRRAIAKEKASAKELELRCFSNLDKFFVSVEDSIQSGNCVPYTNTTRIDVMNKLGIDTNLVIAVRADVLMNIRNDFYSKRAVWFSFITHYKEKSLAW